MDIDSLNFGDRICLYSENVQGFVSSCDDSFILNGPMVYYKLNDEYLEHVPDMTSTLFEIIPPCRFTFDKIYRSKLKESKLNKDNNQELEDAKRSAKLESKENDALCENSFGRILKFGDIIQLRHIHSNKYLHINDKKSSSVERTAMLTRLLPYHGLSAQFILVPTFKVNSVGKQIQYNDYITLESLKAKDQYLRPSVPVHLNSLIFGCELVISVENHGFSIIKSCSYDEVGKKSYLSGLDYVRLHHRDTESLICAEGEYLHSPSENVHLRVRCFDVNNMKTWAKSSNPNIVWQIEKHDFPFNSSPIKQKEKIRLRHATTRHYLSMNNNMQATLLKTCDDPRTVFLLHHISFNKDSKNADLFCNSTVRIENVVTGAWLHAKESQVHERTVQPKEETSEMVSLKWDSANLHPLMISNAKKFSDAFCVENFEISSLHEFRKSMGFAGFAQNIRHLFRTGEINSFRKSLFFVSVFQEMTNSLWNHEKANKVLQKQLRSTQIIDILVEILDLGISTNLIDKNSQFIEDIFIEIYRLLRAYLMGDSNKNRLYIARHFDLFHKQAHFAGQVGREIAIMLTELVKNNIAITERVRADQVLAIIQLLRERRDYIYLHLLSSFCLCGSHAIYKNQILVVQDWLQRDPTGLCFIVRGQNIHRIRNLPYITLDNGATYKPLHVFFNVNHPDYEEDKCKYLSNQLNLFVALGAGGNDDIISMITQDYIDWEGAYLCLNSEVIPSLVRQQFCETICGLFVNIGSNQCVIDNNALSFAYNEMCVHESRINRTSSKLDEIFPTLYQWIHKFIKSNYRLNVNDPQKNNFIKSAFTLLGYLIKFGYFNEEYPIESIIEASLKLLNGRNDTPFYFNEKIGMNEEQFQIFTSYTEGKRFLPSKNNELLIDVKCAVLDVLESAIKFQILSRIKGFITLYKKSCEEEEKIIIFDSQSSVLCNALNETFDPSSVKRKCVRIQNLIRQKLMDFFTERDYFEMEEIRLILLDLSNYDNDILCSKSAAVLAQYFNSKKNVFHLSTDSYLCMSSESEKVHCFAFEKLSQFDGLIHGVWNDQSTNDMIHILKEFVKLCCFSGPTSPNPINQKILFCNGALQSILKVFHYNKDIGLVNLNADKIYSQALIFLRYLSCDMDCVKSKAFQHLDLMLQINRCSEELSQFILEILTNRADLCQQVSQAHLKKVIDRIKKSRWKEPHFIDIILGICIVRGSGFVVKEKVHEVMKLFMRNYKQMADILEWPVQDIRCLLLENKQENEAQRKYLLKIMNLLTVCGVVDSSYIESFCQIVFPMSEILYILSQEDLKLDALFVYSKFFFEIYIKVSKNLFSKLEDILQEENFWLFIIQITQICSKLDSNLLNASDDFIYETLKFLTFNTNFASLNEDQQCIELIFSLIIPLLTNLAEQFDKKMHWNENDYNRFSPLISCVTNVLGQLTPMLASPKQINQIRDFLLVKQRVYNFIDGPGLELLLHAAQYVIQDRDVSEQTRTEYRDKVRDEIVLNQRFQLFVSKCFQIYKGHNTVESQIGIMGNLKAYCEDEGHVAALPLGEEFQEFCLTFIDKSKSEYEIEARYRNLRILLNQLRISFNLKNLSENERKSQEELNAQCLQVICGILRNEIIKLPENWNDLLEDNNIVKQLRFIRRIQNVIVENDYYNIVMLHLINPFSITSKAIYALQKDMLFIASQSSQNALYNYFITAEDNIFTSFREILRACSRVTKNLRDECLEHEKEMNLHVFQDKLLNDFKVKGVAESYRKAVTEVNKENNRLSTFNNYKSNVSNILSDGTITLVLEIISRMTDGQHQPLQDYLRVQSDNVIRVNIVFEICDIISILYSRVDTITMKLLFNLFNSLNEICGGNQINREEILSYKIIDYINFILRSKEFVGCEPDDILNLREIIANFLISLIEENNSAAKKLAQTIFFTIDIPALYAIMQQLYEMSVKYSIEEDMQELVQISSSKKKKMNCLSRMKNFFVQNCACFNKSSSAVKETKSKIYEIGFKFYLVLARFHDIAPMDMKKIENNILSSERTSYTIFSQGAASVEIIKDNVLQKIHFRVENKNCLRENVKMKILWSVDRSSTNKKLCDFIEWRDSVLIDANRFRQVSANLPLYLLMRLWYLFNWIPILLSVAISILIMIILTSSVYDDISPIPLLQNTTYTENLNNALLGCAICHNVVSFFLLLSFLVTERPGIKNVQSWWKNLKSFCHRRKRGKRTVNKSAQHIEDEYTKIEKKNKLEVNIISFTTLYYVLFTLLSILGTIYGYTQLWGYYLFAYHLFNIIPGNQLLERVIQAISGTWLALMWVGLLTLIIHYAIAVIIFSFFRESFQPSNNLWAQTLWSTFVTTVRQVLIFDKWTDFFYPTATERKVFEYWWKDAVLTLIICIIVKILIMNMLMGIIVDYFSKLRADKDEKTRDMLDRCFICGIETFEFDTKGKGASNHIIWDHNMWNYMFLYIFLNDTKRNDYTTLQMFVSDEIKKNSTSYFPVDRAIVLQEMDDSNMFKKTQLANEIIQNISRHLNEKREKLILSEEQKIQMEWIVQKSYHLPEQIRTDSMSKIKTQVKRLRRESQTSP